MLRLAPFKAAEDSDGVEYHTFRLASPLKLSGRRTTAPRQTG
jgi:hypothetical protein